MQNKDTEHRVIYSYDSATGIVTLTNALERYHWGHAVSTAEKYSGVDMRGEVILLTRNVRVVGNDTDSWGGQILVSDNLEFSGVQRSGQLIIDNVEVYNCSQRNTFKSAIRFENQNLKWQSVTNSVIHGSIAWGISA
jgi:hydrogenase maturation factor HypF (carbamoyltransferase family)